MSARADSSRCAARSPSRAGAGEEVRCWRQVDDTYPKTLFLEPTTQSFDRPGIYGDASEDDPDNPLRFALFASAAIEIARRIGEGNLILHAHDWHASPRARLPAPRVPRRTRFAAPAHRGLTVHWRRLPGCFRLTVLRDIGLPEDLWSPDCMEWYGRLIYLKGGLTFADMVTTVSPTHAFELLTDLGGFGLQHTFRQLGDRLVGIRNGIDVDEWNPRNDRAFVAPFWPEEMSGKASSARSTLQDAWGTAAPPRCAGVRDERAAGRRRRVSIKSSRRSRCACRCAVPIPRRGGAQFEKRAARAGRTTLEPDRDQYRVHGSLEHHLLAGADFLMMPSLYEPCGLTQHARAAVWRAPVARQVRWPRRQSIEDGVTGDPVRRLQPRGVRSCGAAWCDALPGSGVVHRSSRAERCAGFLLGPARGGLRG